MQIAEWTLVGVAAAAPLYRQTSGGKRWQALLPVRAERATVVCQMTRGRREELERRLKGVEPGRALVLHGHLDTRPLPGGEVIVPFVESLVIGRQLALDERGALPELPASLARFTLLGTVGREPRVRETSAEVEVHAGRSRVTAQLRGRDERDLRQRLARVAPGAEVRVVGTLTHRRVELGIAEIDVLIPLALHIEVSDAVVRIPRPPRPPRPAKTSEPPATVAGEAPAVAGGNGLDHVAIPDAGAA